MKKLTILITFFALFIIPIYLCTIISAKQHLEQANLTTGEEHFRHLFEAVSWRSPFNYYAYQAKIELELVGYSNDPDKLTALLNLKRGLMKSRSWNFSTDKSELEKINSLIEKFSGEEKKISEDVDTSLHFLTYLLSGTAFWCWIISIIYTICYGFTKKGEINRMPLVYGLSFGTIFFISWLLVIS